MPKATRPYSRYAKEAATLLGQLIRQARIDRKITTQELAERVGLSRGLLRRIENGDLGCTLGAVFETAAVVGVHLFEPDDGKLTFAVDAKKSILALMPKAVRGRRVKADDNF
jgi:transcriptional regulator with XRE-family HTH domain